MKITLAGTSSGMAVANRAPSALFIEIDQDAFLVDAGDGTARQLIRLNLDHSRIQAIIISHMHADHAAGLIGMLQLMHLSGRETPVKIFVPDSIRDPMENLLPLFQIYREKWPFDIQFIGLINKQKISVSGLAFEPILNSHLAQNTRYARKNRAGTESFSLVFWENDQRRCIYTSDISDFSHLENNIKDVDTLISECTHVSTDDGIRFSEQHNIPRIIFTHIPPDVNMKLNVLRKQLTDPFRQFAEDGLTFEIV